MRLTKRHRSEVTESDMTPMIDMTFQLIAFLMVMINFSDIEQDQRVQLPSSELAKPPETAYDEPLTVQMTADETILFGGQEMGIEDLRSAIRREATLLKAYKDNRLDEAMVVIRADLRSRTGSVQEIIEACQEAGFDTFALRGKQSDESTLNSE
ncbi:ExbD/TolR family protein [Botrimarina mediterranea]|uniref:Biopolymer transport protein ExbD n=1 Tax=Botrimarina mediterranea TaxID=2528022 RepID=A0A518KBV0_9BACT|nr:biopolymer transporter ExbD [Botrimarina mediterranea]QDV75271.1 biopolymer transport protein ExbD [Botrimarina mediterranea]QDV79940.1 biopolymer transport protein ExbD [Planctomycetes bacterium K2D]